MKDALLFCVSWAVAMVIVRLLVSNHSTFDSIWYGCTAVLLYQWIWRKS